MASRSAVKLIYLSFLKKKTRSLQSVIMCARALINRVVNVALVKIYNASLGSNKQAY